MSVTRYQIRVYGEKQGDAELIASWWEGHGRERLPIHILPPTGFFVEANGEPVAVAFMYLSVGVGVAFLEWAISKPGQPPQESKSAFAVLIDFMKYHAHSMDYGVLICHTIEPVAKFMQGQGFDRGARPLVSMIGITNEGRMNQHG